MSMALLSPPPPPITLSTKPHLGHKPQVSFHHKRTLPLLVARSADNGAGAVLGSAAVEEKLEVKEEARVPDAAEKEKEKEPLDSNGAAAAKAEDLAFKDPRWVGGTWDLKQFGKDGKTNWDAVIEAEARRRKWLEENPESSSNENPVVFDTSIIPWWAWMKKYHLPEAELLNGRAAMIGFFMAYFVDSLTGVGLVGQMGNFFCKTLLFIAVVGVLFIRKNEDIETLKRLLEETTYYDKQWQATWKDDSTSDSKKS